MHQAEGATIFTEVERQRFMGRELRGEPNHKFPAGGVWVILNEPEHLGDLHILKGANSENEDASNPPIAAPEIKRNHFTTIKLRPVVIRLSVTEGEYDDLNAQALEFEAAARQWVKEQQILTGDWMVDVIEED